MEQSSLHIRAAVAADVPLLRELIQALATFEREPQAPRLTEADLLRDGFGAEPAFTCFIAEWDGVGCGLALFFSTYSTWNGRSLYLEDLFVMPAYRGRGVGKALLSRVAATAAAMGCARLDWSVLEWNEQAIRFYEGLGADAMSEWKRMRLTGEALARVAQVEEQEVRDARTAEASLEVEA